MFLTYFSPSEIKGTIQFRPDQNPFRYGLGKYVDIEGKKWDIEAITHGVVCAVSMECLHPYYKDTSTHRDYGYISQVWEPYNVEIAGE